MSDLLRTRNATTAEMLAIFSDRATIAHALAFETALARALAAEGLIGEAAAEAIAHACSSAAIDPAELAEEVALAGTLAIPLVQRLGLSTRKVMATTGCCSTATCFAARQSLKPRGC